MNAIGSRGGSLATWGIVAVALGLVEGFGLGCNGGGAGKTDGGGAGGHGGQGGQVDGGSVAGQPIPLNQLCANYTTDLCVYLTQCESSDFRDMAQCIAETDCLGVATLTSEVAAGAVGYDATAAGACQARFLADPCHFATYLFTPNVYAVLDQCPGTLTPMRGAGGACDDTSECLAGFYCQRAGGLCPGACTAYQGIGDSCSTGARCAPGNSCSNGMCRAPAKAGDPCASDTDCGGVIYTCPADPPCGDNLWCDIGGSGTCQKGLGVGATCGVVTADGGSNTAIACEDTAWCDAPFDKSGTCQAFGGAATPCNQFGCATGFHCSGYMVSGTTMQTLGTCVPPGSQGDPCVAYTDCVAGLGCPSGTCMPPIGLNGVCMIDSDCQSGLFCSNGVCLTARYPGDPCTDAISACVHSLCSSGVCVDHIKAGQPCSANAACVSGTCASGVCADTSVCGA